MDELIIKTKRLLIRPLKYEDYESWYNGFNSRNEKMSKYDSGKLDMRVCNENWFINLVDKHHSHIENDFVYVFSVFSLKTNEHIGMVDITTIMRDEFQWAKIGYFIHNHHWRQGYAFECLVPIVKLAFDCLGYHRIEAHINIDNDPSINLIEKLGFKFECVREKFILENNEWTDNYVFYKNKI